MILELALLLALVAQGDSTRTELERIEQRLASTWVAGDCAGWRFTDVFIRTSGRWLVVASHATKVGQ